MNLISGLVVPETSPLGLLGGITIGHKVHGVENRVADYGLAMEGKTLLDMELADVVRFRQDLHANPGLMSKILDPMQMMMAVMDGKEPGMIEEAMLGVLDDTVELLARSDVEDFTVAASIMSGKLLGMWRSLSSYAERDGLSSIVTGVNIADFFEAQQRLDISSASSCLDYISWVQKTAKCIREIDKAAVAAKKAKEALSPPAQIVNGDLKIDDSKAMELLGRMDGDAPHA